MVNVTEVAKVPNIHIILGTGTEPSLRSSNLECPIDRWIENVVYHSSPECEKTNPPTAAELEAYAAVYGDDALCDQDLNQACVRVSEC